MVTMHGPAFDTGKTKEQEVHPDNVVAFQNAGWVIGKWGDKPEEEAPKATVKRTKGRKKKGE